MYAVAERFGKWPHEFAELPEPTKGRLITWEMIRRAEDQESHGESLQAASMGAVRL